MILKKYETYLYSLFIKKFILISFIFFCLVIIVNFFEEVRFSEKYEIDIFYSVYLSLLNAPSLIFEIFPFIFLITVKIFYVNLHDNNELKILNSNGISNFRIIFLLLTIFHLGLLIFSLQTWLLYGTLACLFYSVKNLTLETMGYNSSLFLNCKWIV